MRKTERRTVDLDLNSIMSKPENQRIWAINGINRLKLTFNNLSIHNYRLSACSLAMDIPELGGRYHQQPTIRIRKLNLTRRDKQ